MQDLEHVAVSEAMWCGEKDLLTPGQLGLLVEWLQSDGSVVQCVRTFYPHMGPPNGLPCEPYEVRKIVGE